MTNSHKTTVFIILLSTLISSAQVKLKGDKIVTTEDRNISEFTTIEVIDNLNVFLVYNEKQSVEVEADSNLQNSILTELNNGILTIRTSAIIGRNKALNIHLKVNKNIQEINAYNNAKVNSKNTLAINDLTINSYDDAVFNLKLNLKNIEIHGTEKSRLNLEILSEVVAVRIENSCNLTAIIDAKETSMVGLDNAITTLKGTSNSLEIEFSGDSSYKGKDFIAANAIVKSNNNAKLYVHVTKELNLLANNSSEVHLYANPAIALHGFYDKALIKKRELD
ncbi:Putative auto-transporter adhesin, head GIN domain [Lutibacter agarilyticus]|uniref:Putative auto-transporter adhesin, head GIN domain n=1 Tax=Lutibacter agarilyticus TaxID=1109740 RepID=A0A238WIR8_9FLAO|nr:DUF2807 domain-containing protein [Lutibacter agarilyticus]SNR46377.1 Putative auto-transporter adhesin, head GIN domain [Lutibacter agarilyticus]